MFSQEVFNPSRGVTLPRPRDIFEVRLDKEFHALHREIWSVLKDEVMKGYAQSTQAAEAV